MFCVSTLNLYPKDRLPDNAILNSTVFGINFSNPIGLAAGFDKNGECAEQMKAMGFGFVEVMLIIIIISKEPKIKSL